MTSNYERYFGSPEIVAKTAVEGDYCLLHFFADAHCMWPACPLYDECTDYDFSPPQEFYLEWLKKESKMD